jgi:class 3 adenylate cyclase/pimeloyl-ACP methyl ester carboxylesterase
MEPQIRFCTSADGIRIAYAAVGEGPPLVTTPSSWESMSFVLQNRVGGRFYEALAKRYTVIRYDRRGVGLSDRERTDFTLQADLEDLETVADGLALKRFALMGSFHLGPAVIVYAARHPHRISRLILYGTYACGRVLTREDVKRSLMSMVRSHWGIASRTLADMTAPGVGGEMLEAIARDERESATGEMVAKLVEMAYATDVVELLPEVKVPTLVVHRRGDRVIPFRLSRELTSVLPAARLVALEGVIHWPWFGDSDSVLKAIDEFLREGEEAAGAEAPEAGAFRTVLFTDVEGSTALTQRLGDARARELLREHERIVREALKAHGGAEVKTIGDGFMTSFSSATRALESAIAMQRAFAAHNESAEEPIRVRVGLNAGEPIAEEKDLYGTAVNLAARICGQAEPGQILASDVVQQLAAGKGFVFADQGEATLKGFEKPVRLHEVRWQNEG